MAHIAKMTVYIAKPRNGFTLTELLVSTAILSGLVLVMFNVVDNASRAWRGTEQRVDAFREARAALFIIARDLAAAINLNKRDPRLPAFVLGNENQPIDANVAKLSGSPPPLQNGHRIFFFAAMPEDAQEAGANKSDICSVGYYMDFVRPKTAEMQAAGQQGSYVLRRYFRSSDPTFTTITSGTTPLFQGSISDDLLARNVIDFYVLPLRADGTTVSLWPTNEMPAYVEVSLTAFNYATANQFDRSDWKNRNSPTYKAKRQTFTTRVAISAP